MITRARKPKLEGVPTSVTEMEALALATLEANRRLESLVNEKAAAMERAAAAFSSEIEAATQEVKSGLDKLEMWAEMNRPLFGEQRSIEIAGKNRLGWRLGNHAAATVKGKTWKDVQAALVEKVRAGVQLAAEMLRTKTEPNKERIVELREDPAALAVMAEVGVEVKQGESFYLE